MPDGAFQAVVVSERTQVWHRTRSCTRGESPSLVFLFSLLFWVAGKCYAEPVAIFKTRC